LQLVSLQKSPSDTNYLLFNNFSLLKDIIWVILFDDKLVGLFGLGSKDPKKKSFSKKKKELRKLVKEKKYDSALRIGTEILKNNPDENDILFIIGGIYYMKGKYKTAISYFEKSLEIATHDVEVLILNANSYFRLGSFKQAIHCCDTIKEIDPKNKGVIELLEKIKSAQNN